MCLMVGRLWPVCCRLTYFLFYFIAQLAILPFILLFHDISFYYKYMVRTERMSRVVEKFLLPMPDKISANNSVKAYRGYLSGMNNKASYLV